MDGEEKEAKAEGGEKKVDRGRGGQKIETKTVEAKRAETGGEWKVEVGRWQMAEGRDGAETGQKQGRGRGW